MSAVEAGVDTMYHGNVPVVLKQSDREDRQATLTLGISYMTGPRVLHMQLTDESDAYLLYTVDISDDDFHMLKAEQSILVDFPTFPSKCIELLRQCQAAAGEEHPRFIAVMATTGGIPLFTVIETNPFRQIAHLALRFVAGDDSTIKKYLAGRVADYKRQLAYVRDELGEHTAQLQETAELATRQTERLRTIEDEHGRQINALEAQHQGAIAAAKEQAAMSQQEQLRFSDQERARVVERSETELARERENFSRTAAELAQLTTAYQELQLRLRECTGRLGGAEHEVRRPSPPSLACWGRQSRRSAGCVRPTVDGVHLA
jgi:spindle assembly abnormal protein 6